MTNRLKTTARLLSALVLLAALAACSQPSDSNFLASSGGTGTVGYKSTIIDYQ